MKESTLIFSGIVAVFIMLMSMIIFGFSLAKDINKIEILRLEREIAIVRTAEN